MTVEQIAQLAQQHPQMRSVLQRRLTQVRRLKELWSTGNLSSLSSVLQMPQDQAVFCDFVRAVMQHKLEASLNLDACQLFLPVVRDLMNNKYDDFAIASLEFAEVLLQHFGGLISDTRRSQDGVNARQTNITREERLQKCDICYEHFQEIYRLLPENRLSGRFSTLRHSLQAFLQRR
jgi:hypothetical protein